MKRGLYLKWLKRLRKQKHFGRSGLHWGTGAMCPLGVLCEAAELEKRYDEQNDLWEYRSSKRSKWNPIALPNDAARKFGMKRFGDPHNSKLPSISELIDVHGWGPKRVADYIRDHRKYYIKELT